MSDKKKIIKVDVVKNNSKKLELNEMELALKQELIDVNSKVNSVFNVIDELASENKDLFLDEEMAGSIIGVLAITKATQVIGKYLELSEDDINNLV